MASEPKSVRPGGTQEPTGSVEEDSAGITTDVSPVVVDAIGKALKAHFRAIADIPLPDRFLVLLAELESRERRHDN